MVVVAVNEESAVPYAEGRSFGDAGAAVIRRLTVEHAVDPSAEVNQSIVDLGLAERDADGLVHFDHDVLIVQPSDAQARNGWALVDVVNRGGPTVPMFLEFDNSPVYPRPPEPPAGDGYLLEQGWSLVFCGWQFDIADRTLTGLRAPQMAGGESITGEVSYEVVPAMGGTTLPLILPGHSRWPVAPGTTAVLFDDDTEVPSDPWSFADDGAALLSDDGFQAGHHYTLRFTAHSPVVGGCGLLALRDTARWLREAEALERNVLFGVSQSGRVIRQFLSEGLNIDESGNQAYDAVMPLIAGGRRGQFNRRFAIPGALPVGTDGIDTDGTYGALLAASDTAGVAPKVMAVNTSSEYWRGDAALVHGDGHPDVRVHYIAGTQHMPGYAPQLFEIPGLGWKGQHGFNTVDWRPVNRALLAQLVDWVEHGVAPEPSTVPDDAHLTDRATVLAQFEAMGIATPRIESFVQPPGPVPVIDDTGNETAGIRLPDIAAPLGVHAGWNIRHPDMGAPDDELFLMGTTKWSAELPTLDEHLDATHAITSELAERRFVLTSDTELIAEHQQTRWNDAAI